MVTLPVEIFGSWLVLISAPCLPVHLGYLFLTECISHPITFKMILFRLLSSSLFVWVGTLTLGNCVLAYTFYSVIPCYSIINYICLIERQKYFSSNSNFQFNQKFYKLWNQIQILTSTYNSIHQNCITIVSSMLFAVVFIISLYTAVGFHETLHTLQVWIFALCVFQAVTLTIDLDGNVNGMVYGKSRQCLHKFSRDRVIMKSRLNRRHLKSLPAVKINKGSAYFYDELLPLNVINFNVSQTVNLLLM